MRLIDANALIRKAKRRSEVYKLQGLSKAIEDMVQYMTIYAPHPYEMRWIPCSERMPSDENKVLCCTQTKSQNKKRCAGLLRGRKMALRHEQQRGRMDAAAGSVQRE